MKQTFYLLPNGRIYRVSYSGRPYTGGEYPCGGYLICLQKPNCDWWYIDNSPDEECVQNFLKSASRLTPIPRYEEQCKAIGDIVQKTGERVIEWGDSHE